MPVTMYPSNYPILTRLGIGTGVVTKKNRLNSFGVDYGQLATCIRQMLIIIAYTSNAPEIRILTSLRCSVDVGSWAGNAVPYLNPNLIYILMFQKKKYIYIYYTHTHANLYIYIYYIYSVYWVVHGVC